jgi:hypothetical protein
MNGKNPEMGIQKNQVGPEEGEECVDRPAVGKPESVEVGRP